MCRQQGVQALCETHLAHKVEVVTDPLLQGWRNAMEIIGPPRQHNNLQLQNKFGQKMIVTVWTCTWALKFPSWQRPYLGLNWFWSCKNGLAMPTYIQDMRLAMQGCYCQYMCCHQKLSYCLVIQKLSYCLVIIDKALEPKQVI